MFTASGEQLSYSQLGHFSQPRLCPDGTYVAVGPDGTEARLTQRDRLATSGPPRLWIIAGIGQSNQNGATANADGFSDPTIPHTLRRPFPGKLLMFNGGIYPVAAKPTAASRGVIVQPDRYESIVDACERPNEFREREGCLMSAGEVFARYVRPEDKVLLIDTSLGSCTFTSLIEREPGKPKAAWNNLLTLTAAACAWAETNDLTPEIAGLSFNQGESDQGLPSVKHRLRQLAILRERTNELKTITGQRSEIPIIHPAVGASIFNINQAPRSNAHNDNPDASLIGTVSPVTLAAERNARRLDPNMATFAQYCLDCNGTSRVHYSGRGHSEGGQIVGHLLLDWHEGKPIVHPHIVRVEGERGASTRVVTLDREAVIDDSLVTDPGAYGFRYFDDEQEHEIESVELQAATVTLRLKSTPSGVGERATYACSNGDRGRGHSGARWPFKVGDHYLGPRRGQRGQLRDAGWHHFDHRTGKRLGRYFLHQEVIAIISDAAVFTRL